ncbi:unnamed protein product [Brassica oleracea var. botrytis]|uniref:(rape) hypothetical protein n=1 Tax=Brassica napus TaxID=3708 RepID=A0A078GQU1_BRANA|nr:unnamed protein product [Brassica napus]CDY27544.1 BnaC01g32270D [Brassica napus]
MWAMWPYRSQQNQLHYSHLTGVNPISTGNYLLDSAFTPQEDPFCGFSFWDVITIEHVLGVLRSLQISLLLFYSAHYLVHLRSTPQPDFMSN